MAYSKHGKIGNLYKSLVGKPEERKTLLGRIDADMRITLKWI